ncbi:flavin reductase family protein [Plantactinospora endophytica]|uniref:Flavin reductase like domain-containing protein n=1 Tax=Plantactinospora endophytica TaxID=673535 RepID=A0ABQ4EC40_9ACTN|nr:flavin reductase family protein [Plantactinospora endophytica]GIG92293.1 hypothetical protein Pen02_72290 [Plantactinospora endophytica]
MTTIASHTLTTPTAVSADEQRLLMSSYPTGVSVITAVDAYGMPHGMTCTSLSSVTLRPPTLLICLNAKSGTLAAIGDQGVFAVNLLHSGAQATAELFASRTPDRFRDVAWKPADRSGAPWLVDDALAVAECTVRRRLPVGDHDVVIGEVINLRYSEGTPLLYGMRRYSRFDAREAAGS